ncbi:thioredoxin family protein [Bacillus sp. Bos-x628]|uniref:thioredoxin family protein n=1 Tax=Bacillus maqinnsis TaxID=3229854 RepID=UPI00338FA285
MKVIIFKQSACQPCQMLENYYSFELGIKPDITYNLSDGDDDSVNAAMKFGIMATPALVLVDNNENEIERIVGFNGKQDLIREMFLKAGKTEK